MVPLDDILDDMILTPYFRKPRSSSPKNEPFSQEMHLKIPLFEPWFEIVKF